ncbi:MAG: glycerol-3-phosphate 1-O-acyltransferase PlsY [Hyphomicrobiaceae bacterium]
MLSTPILQLAALALAGYLLGSIPFGLLLTRAAGLGDVRSIGSGNIGATNVLRTGNKKLAALTLLLDVLKGTAAVLLGVWIGAQMAAHAQLVDMIPASNPANIDLVVARAKAETFVMGAGLAAGLGAFVGHIFPVWLGFKGGKGVATYIGVLIGAVWQAALVFAAAWLLTAVVTRYSSLSALVATLVAFVYLAATGGPFVVPAVAIMSALLFWKHRENIRRLVAGTESKIGAKG